MPTVALDGRGAERGPDTIVAGVRAVAADGIRVRVFGDPASLAGVTARQLHESIGARNESALHYHFASKAELGAALIERYATRFMATLAEIEPQPIDAAAKLAAYADVYAGVLRRERMCLCGMLAADYETLPGPMREAVVRFVPAFAVVDIVFVTAAAG
jgi:hypothetical protein